MAYGVLENNIVVNAVEATPEFAASQGWKPLSGSAGIGWKFHPGINTFSPPDALPPLPTRTAKNAIWERATDAEAEQMEAALASQPVRIRRIYEGATHIASDHELFPMMMGVLTALFGEARANDLLAPTA